MKPSNLIKGFKFKKSVEANATKKVLYAILLTTPLEVLTQTIKATAASSESKNIPAEETIIRFFLSGFAHIEETST